MANNSAATAKNMVKQVSAPPKKLANSISATFLQGVSPEAKHSKTFTKSKNGSIEKQDYTTGRRFEGGQPTKFNETRVRLVEYCMVKGLQEFSRKLKKHKDCYRIYASPQEWEQQPGFVFANRKNETFLQPALINLLMLDMDGELQTNLQIKNRAAIVAFVHDQFRANRLEWLVGYEMVVVFSSSIEVDVNGCISRFRAHIYLHIDRELPIELVRNWALGMKKTGCSWMDHQVFKQTQPDYFCRRKFVGMRDHLTEADRIFYVAADPGLKGKLVPADKLEQQALQVSVQAHAQSTSSLPTGWQDSGGGYQRFMGAAGLDAINEPCYRACTSYVYQHGCSLVVKNLRGVAAQLHQEAWQAIEANQKKAGCSRVVTDADRDTYDVSKFVGYLQSAISFVSANCNDRDEAVMVLLAEAERDGLAGVKSTAAKDAWQKLVDKEVFEEVLEKVKDAVVDITQQKHGKKIGTKLEKWFDRTYGGAITARARSKQKMSQAAALAQLQKDTAGEEEKLPMWDRCFEDYGCSVYLTEGQKAHLVNVETGKHFHGNRTDVCRLDSDQGERVYTRLWTRFQKDVQKAYNAPLAAVPPSALKYASYAQQCKPDIARRIVASPLPGYGTDTTTDYVANCMYDREAKTVRKRLWAEGFGVDATLYIDPLQKKKIWKVTAAEGLVREKHGKGPVIFENERQASSFPKLRKQDLQRIARAKLVSGKVPESLWPRNREFLDGYDIGEAGPYQAMAIICHGFMANQQQPIVRVGVDTERLHASQTQGGSGTGKSVLMAYLAGSIDPKKLEQADSTGKLVSMNVVDNVRGVVSAIKASYVAMFDNVNSLKDIDSEVLHIMKLVATHADHGQRELYKTTDLHVVELDGLVMISGLGSFVDGGVEGPTDLENFNEVGDFLNRLVEINIAGLVTERSEGWLMRRVFRDEDGRRERLVEVLCCVVALLRGYDEEYSRQFHRLGDFEQTFYRFAPAEVFKGFVSGKQAAHRRNLLAGLPWIGELKKAVAAAGGKVEFPGVDELIAGLRLKHGDQLKENLTKQRKSKARQQLVDRLIEELKEVCGVVWTRKKSDGKWSVVVTVEKGIEEWLKVLNRDLFELGELEKNEYFDRIAPIDPDFLLQEMDRLQEVVRIEELL